MNRAKTVDEYIANSEVFKDELIRLRSLLSSSELIETVKWGAPCYTVNGKNVVGIGAFKSYVGLWFHQGALLQDKSKVLINAQEGTTKALRQWRFNSIDEMDDELILSYIEEAIKNEKAGKSIKPNTKKPLIIPDELTSAFKDDPGLGAMFESLNLTKKREFAEYISSAKREETKLSRLDKIIPMIRDGIGLNDKYRK